MVRERTSVGMGWRRPGSPALPPRRWLARGPARRADRTPRRDATKECVPFGATIPLRESYGASFGLVVEDLGDYTEALAELTAIEAPA